MSQPYITGLAISGYLIGIQEDGNFFGFSIFGSAGIVSRSTMFPNPESAMNAALRALKTCQE